MAKRTDANTPLVVEQFWVLCNKAHEYWLNHLGLFDNNPRNAESMKSVAKEEWMRLSVISHEYSLLQIIKLHDPAIMNGNITLGIDYMVRYGSWREPVRLRLEELKVELDSFAKKVRGARNKILSHNDLSTIVAGTTLGDFDERADEKYFESLQEFVNVVHGEVIGGPYPFCSLVRGDVAFSLRSLNPPTTDSLRE